jgi:glycerophosphoryl diester phosphodiesterase
LVREWKLVDRVQVRSFYHPVLRQLHEIAPEIAISELWFDHLPEDDETFFKTINSLWTLYTPQALGEIHARGQKATAWTVNDVETAQSLIEMGIDGLTTDYPDRLLPLVRQQ